jgi:hypothetical protein
LDTQRIIPKYRIAIIIVLCILGMSFVCPLERIIPALPVSQTSLPTQPTLPEGWKLSKDPSGACQVATPPDWQLGRDFFLSAGSTNPGPFVSTPEQFPPMGLALWGVDDITQLPKNHQFQIRTSLVIGERVCSVWFIKQSTDFTDVEKNTMQQVGETLQEVH